MTELQINQLIHERVMGKCWHDADKRVGDSFIIPLQWFCTKCGDEVGHEGVYMSPLHPSYTSSWADYGRLLEKFKTLDCFGDFIDWLIESDELNNLPLDNALIVVFDILTCLKCDDRHGARIIAEFVKERGI